MPRPTFGTATIEDVARRAGVSRATAARVLAGSGAASSQAREKVTSAASALQYSANRAARALATAGGTRVVIAVVTPGPTLVVDNYLGRVVSAAAQTCATAGVGVAMLPLPLHDNASLAALAADRTVQGVVLVNTTESALHAIPPRLVGRVASIGVGSATVPSVDVDNGGGAESILRYLYESGRRRIAMIAGPSWLPCTARTRRAYNRVMREAGLPARTIAGDFSTESGRAGAQALIRRWPNTDAIFASCDANALGVLAALRTLGVSVPADVAVAGFDDLGLAELGYPPLTTASHPAELISHTAALTVLTASHVRPPDRRFASELIRRASA